MTDRLLMGTVVLATLATIALVIRHLTRLPDRPPGRRLRVGEAAAATPATLVERSVIVIGFSTLSDERTQRLAADLRAIQSRSAAGADGHTRLFSTVGVALDGDVRAGVEWLRKLGHLSEIDVGRTWYNNGAAAYIWSDTSAAVVPQVILTERVIHEEVPGRISFGEPQVLRRALGGPAISAWALDSTARFPFRSPPTPNLPTPR